MSWGLWPPLCPTLIKTLYDAHRVVPSSTKAKRETLRRATQCPSHSKLVGFTKRWNEDYVIYWLM